VAQRFSDQTGRTAMTTFITLAFLAVLAFGTLPVSGGLFRR
jgi:hypothetical protein